MSEDEVGMIGKGKPKSLMPKTYFQHESGRKTPILMKKKGEGEADWLTRMRKLGYNLEQIEKHEGPNPNEIHAGSKTECSVCKKRTSNTMVAPDKATPIPLKDKSASTVEATDGVKKVSSADFVKNDVESRIKKDQKELKSISSKNDSSMDKPVLSTISKQVCDSMDLVNDVKSSSGLPLVKDKVDESYGEEPKEKSPFHRN